MRLEDQCCTLEQAKKLSELGIIQGKSIFFWERGDIVYNKKPVGEGYKFATFCFSAFTVAELGVMLPLYYPSWRFENPKDNGDLWIATVVCKPKPAGIDDLHTAHEFDRYGSTQAQALAILLISLLECEVITAEEINARLKQ